MKLLNNLFLILFALHLVICLKNKLNTRSSKCSISSISIPKGSNLPVVVFRVTLNEGDVKMTVLEKEHMNKYKVKGNLVMDDKINGESWYVDNKYDETKFESMRDAFSLCKSIHEENKEMRLYEQNESNRKNNNLLKFRTQSLPDNVEIIPEKEKAKNDSSNSSNKSNPNEITPGFLETNSKVKNLSKVEAKEPFSDIKLKGLLKNQEKDFNFGSFLRLKEILNFNDFHF